MTATAATLPPGPGERHEPAPAGPSIVGRPGPPLVGRVRGAYRSVYRFLGRRAVARATLAVPRTARFVWRGGGDHNLGDAAPPRELSVALLAQVAMDEALLAVALTPSRFPRRSDYVRVAAELADARRLMSRRGWLRHPAGYHRTPPALRDGEVAVTAGRALGVAYEHLRYPSGFTPRPSEPGAARWTDFAANHTAVANVVRRGSGPAPWLVCVHGFCMGYPLMDFQGLHTARLGRELRANLALPVLPLHGPRKATRISGEAFLSFDLMNAVHGLTQAVWDIRRLISWIRAQGATSIGVYGVSLGAYVAALVASIEPGVDAVMAGIPVSDFPALFHEHSPLHIRARSIEHRILGGVAEDVFTVVSPLAFDPTVPVERRFIFAGHGDRLALPDQAATLWRHWGRPSLHWYPGNHVGYLWSKSVGDFVVASLAAAGFGEVSERAVG